ncbi:aminopeptidase P family N-terminal domain-containing protein, partial [Candidatus Pelagibacter sp.]|nr:aminopeptidase P family N-terminal domain-containing protein [Candidatus Pelagibacter sp.]
MKNLIKVKKLLNTYNLDAYIIPKNDEFFGEYASPNRLKTISNFSGSAGFSIITKFVNYLFVDGRYSIQSKMESGKNFKIIEIPYHYPKNILNTNIINKIGYDPKLFTRSTLERYFGYKFQLIPINTNLVDEIFQEQRNKEKMFFKLDDKIVGESEHSKINRLFKVLNKNKSDSIFISAPENVAWLLNIRGQDNPNSPIPNARLIIDN